MHYAQTAAPILSEQAMWRAVLARDRAADGLFFFGVTTTGIYCRPACPARRPLREHVAFYSSGEQAQRAGLRACKRCRPSQMPDPALALCQTVLELALKPPAGRWSDKALSTHGFDPVQVRRAFLTNFGRTFHAHLRALRVAKAREHVSAGRSLSDAGARAGFESESGLRAAFRAVLDTTPAASVSRSTLEVLRLGSPLGPLTAAATRDGVCLLEFDLPQPGERGPSERTQTRVRHVALKLGCRSSVGTNLHLEKLQLQLEQWFRGERKQFDLPLVYAGSEFEVEVWRKLGSIPYGETWSYGELARALNRPKAARAVGHANSMNPIAILVPCHRVIGAAGELTGYAAGLDRKRWLLEHERSGSWAGNATPARFTPNPSLARGRN